MNRSIRLGFIGLCLAVVAGFGYSTATADVIGPYLQNVTPHGVVVRWATTDPTKPDKFVFHKAPITGCQPGKHYEYTVGDNNEFKVSFTTAPITAKPFRFVVYGDTRTHADIHAKVASKIAAANPALVLHTGDIVVDGRKADLWQTGFFGPAAPFLSKSVLYTVLGNHEHDSANYFNFFELPGNERYYSFDYAKVHFVVLDTNEPSFPKEHKGESKWADEFVKVINKFWNDQIEWLRKDLAAHADARLTVLCQHSPLYDSSKSETRQKNYAKLRARLVPELQRFGVDVVFAGHDHFYERNVVDGIQYVVTGGGGAPLYSAGDKLPTERAHADVNHYLIVDVKKNAVKVRALDLDGNTLDSFTLELGK